MRAMKDSGIEWIGEIPESWKLSKLKYLGKYINGYAFKPDNWGNVGKKIIRIQDLTESYNNPNYYNGEIDEKYNVTYGDILVSWAATLNAFIWKKEDGLLNQHIFKAIPDCELVDKSFFFWLIKEAMKNMNNDNKHGIFMQHVTLDVFNNFSVPMPPLAEQHCIAAHLDRQCTLIDSVIEKTKASIEEYKKLRQAVITQAVTKGVRGERAMKESGYKWIGKIPKEWTLIPAKYLFRSSDIRKLPDDVQLTASQKHGIVSQQKYMELENAKVVFANQGIENWKHVEPNDFIISLRSFQGGLELSEVAGCITWHYIVLKALKPVNYRYFKWLFKSKIYITALQRTCNYIRDGQDLRYSNFIQVPLFEPSMEEQQEIAAYLDKKCVEIDTLITKKETFLTELESYKKSMIYEYVTGKKEIPHNDSNKIVTILHQVIIPPNDIENAKALLMYYILFIFGNKLKGRTQLAKTFYNVEVGVGLNFNTQYARYPHGPYSQEIEKIEDVLIKNGWLKRKNSSPVQYQIIYKPKVHKEYERVFSAYKGEIEEIIKYYIKIGSRKSEKVATLFAAWNDFIIDGQIKPSDEIIIQDITTNWTANKAKTPYDVWLSILNEMKKAGITPKGYGKHTI